MLHLLRALLKDLPVDDQDQLLEELAQRAVRERMGPVLIMVLESSKPVSFITGQAAIAATPLLGAFVEPIRIERFADLFSDRQFVERLIQRVEELEAEQGGESSSKDESST